MFWAFFQKRGNHKLKSTSLFKIFLSVSMVETNSYELHGDVGGNSSSVILKVRTNEAIVNSFRCQRNRSIVWPSFTSFGWKNHEWYNQRFKCHSSNHRVKMSTRAGTFRLDVRWRSNSWRSPSRLRLGCPLAAMECTSPFDKNPTWMTRNPFSKWFFNQIIWCFVEICWWTLYN